MSGQLKQGRSEPCGRSLSLAASHVHHDIRHTCFLIFYSYFLSLKFPFSESLHLECVHLMTTAVFVANEFMCVNQSINHQMDVVKLVPKQEMPPSSRRVTDTNAMSKRKRYSPTACNMQQRKVYGDKSKAPTKFRASSNQQRARSMILVARGESMDTYMPQSMTTTLWVGVQVPSDWYGNLHSIIGCRKTVLRTFQRRGQKKSGGRRKQECI